MLHDKFDANVYYTGIPISNNKTIYTNKGVTWPVEVTQQLKAYVALEESRSSILGIHMAAHNNL